MIKKVLQENLDKLIGKQLTFVGHHEGDFFMMEFGVFENGKDITEDKLREMRRYALHISSFFRILESDQKEVILGKLDIYAPNSENVDDETFDWHNQGTTKYDEKVNAWFTHIPIYVESVELNQLGDLKMYFSNGDLLEVYVNSSTDEECWRFFDRLDSRGHIIVTGERIYEE